MKKTLLIYAVAIFVISLTTVLLFMAVNARHEKIGTTMASRSNAVERVHAVRNSGRTRRIGAANASGFSNASVRPAKAIPEDSCRKLAAMPPSGSSASELAQMASDKNEVMDELLNQDNIPADYGTQMVALFRDGRQDAFTRDFAVQHIGLYAQALHRRGLYDPRSRDSRMLRAALHEAASRADATMAASALRALADMAAFDPLVDRGRLDARIAACADDASAAPAVRTMAVQLCGERGLASSRGTLERLASGQSAPLPLRLAAQASLQRLSSH